MIDLLRKEYNLDIIAPFKIDIEGTTHQFDCLIKGYGATNGMVIDHDYSKLSPVSDKLVSLNYGFSCFNINDETSGFNEVLNDWGKIV